MAHDVMGTLYTDASMAVTNKRGASGVACSESRMRIS
jgi:hypothetical protein